MLFLLPELAPERLDGYAECPSCIWGALHAAVITHLTLYGTLLTMLWRWVRA